MKMSYRDKVILITLLVILVWVIGVMAFIKPKFDDLKTTNTEYDDRVVVLQQKKDQIKQDEDLPQRVKEAFASVTDVANNFYDKMTPDEVSTKIDNLLDEDNITNMNLSISAYSAVTLDYINATPTQLQTDVDKIAEASDALNPANTTEEAVSDDGATGPVIVPAYTVSFSYKCSLEDLESFLDKLISRNEKSLIVTNCSIADINEEVIEGEMTMVLMMMPRMQDPMAANEAANKGEAAADTSSSEAAS